jgi:DNA topoisomerase-1
VGDDLHLRFTGQKKRFAGFTTVYEEVLDDAQAEEEENTMPDFREGAEAKLLDVSSEQRFTQPPPRFTEASLVRALEEKGIGRPSTYSPTITTIMARGYIARENKRLVPTELGQVVNDLMQKNFPDIVNVQFTADMEAQLDEVEEGNADWHKVIADFYGPFEKALAAAEASIEKVSV